MKRWCSRYNGETVRDSRDNVPDMGIFRTTIAVENPTTRDKRVEIAEVMVDTGAEYTWVPRAVLQLLGVAPERSARFQTADGRVLEREIGFANVYVAGTSAPDIVVFA